MMNSEDDSIAYVLQQHIQIYRQSIQIEHDMSLLSKTTQMIQYVQCSKGSIYCNAAVFCAECYTCVHLSDVANNVKVVANRFFTRQNLKKKQKKEMTATNFI